MTKRLFPYCMAALLLSLSASVADAQAARPVTVDVLYMNHGPLRETLNQMRAVFSDYGGAIKVVWYDFDSQEGERFKARKGINRHVPLIIWIDGSSECSTGNKKVEFVGFPTGSGPVFFQGKWTMEELKAVLDRSAGRQ